MLILFLALLSTANSLTYKKLSIEDLTKSADTICIGKCVSKSSRFVDHHIETTIEIKVTEYLKGDMGKTLSVTVMGGEIEQPLPLAQHVLGTPTFVKGEEVLLFLSAPQKSLGSAATQAKSPASLLATSPSVVGWFQGKYTVLTDSVTGEKKVANFNFENAQAIPSDYVRTKLYQALENSHKTKADPQTPQIQKDIESLLPLSKEDAAKTIDEKEVKRGKQEPETMMVGPIKIAKTDARTASNRQKAEKLKKPESTNSKLRRYFDTLESLESFKQRIKDCMTK
jgi:hypothetical protein